MILMVILKMRRGMARALAQKTTKRRVAGFQLLMRQVTPAGYVHRGSLLSKLARVVLEYASVLVEVSRPPSRREQIQQRHEGGESLSDLTREYGMPAAGLADCDRDVTKERILAPCLHMPHRPYPSKSAHYTGDLGPSPTQGPTP